MPTFGDKFWALLSDEIAKRTAAKQPPPSREERIQLLNKLHEEELMVQLAQRIKEQGPASGLFDRPKSPPKRKPMHQMSEEEFIKFLEEEPALQGVDVKKEIGRCQFWCRANGAECSRRRIFNWVMKADRTIAFNGSGASSKPNAPVRGYPEPPNWRQWLKANRPESVYAEGMPMAFKPWQDLDYTAKKYIYEQIKEGAA